MAKNQNKKQKTKERLDISPETIRAIFAIFLLLLALISLLSIFNLAAQFGIYLIKILKIVFGQANFLFPLILIFLSFSLFFKEKISFNKRLFLGNFLFLFSFLALSHIFIPFEEAYLKAKQGQGGGILGYLFSFPFKSLMGFWGGIIFFFGLILVSIFILFNTSPRRIWEKSQIFKELFLRKIYDLKLKISSKKQEPAEPVFKKEKANILPQEREEKSKKNKEKAKQLTLSTKQGFPLDLLEISREVPKSGNIPANMEIIKKTLGNFNIPVEMKEVNVGPTVTQYTLRPLEGVRLSEITALQNNLSLALAAHPLRIEAPIPGKSLVGIEVPNQEVAIVKLKEVLESDFFKKRRTNLSLALGKDVAGQAFIADLESMPHLLIAGATGSGKSVCINSIILSFLFQNSPSQLKLILVDPKRVEMSCFNNIPHLLTPVIVDLEQTINALRWAVEEMERRFKIFHETGKRNIIEYNKEEEFLSYIVIIIDELADLMSLAPSEIEGLIIRLAQMARATGIHLIVSTQRPSVNVITGLIKANITSRIAFNVASSTDSRTILDQAGAEKLLGKGDMLFISPFSTKPKRVQGTLVSEKEIEKVTSYLKENFEVEYKQEIVEKRKEMVFEGEGKKGLEDELFEEAKKVVIQADKASASLLQRRLKIGYARAARLLDILEEQGIIGPADGAKPRDVLLKEEF